MAASRLQHWIVHDVMLMMRRVLFCGFYSSWWKCVQCKSRFSRMPRWAVRGSPDPVCLGIYYVLSLFKWAIHLENWCWVMGLRDVCAHRTHKHTQRSEWCEYTQAFLLAFHTQAATLLVVHVMNANCMGKQEAVICFVQSRKFKLNLISRFSRMKEDKQAGGQMDVSPSCRANAQNGMYI